MSIKHRTKAERVLAALKLTGMAAALSFVMMLALTGCPTDSGTDSEPPVKFTVTFNANGGTVAPASVEVETGKTATLPTPANATAGQNVFQGWYTANGTSSGDWGNRFTDATPVTADIPVYAKWGAAAPTTYTVKFESDGGSNVPSVTVNDGDTLGTLPAPTKTGNTLSGWFRAENEGGTKFTGTMPVTANITLYAKWTAAPSGGGKSKLTITDIPEELKDKYVFAMALQGEFWGLAEKPAAGAASFKAVKITGTTVVIPLWVTADFTSWTAYEGNESYKVNLLIGDSEDMPTDIVIPLNKTDKRMYN